MEIARVDLRGVVPGGAGWEAARAAVTASMVAHGCVLITHDALGPDTHRELFAGALPELFALPLETKQRAASTRWQFNGYVSNIGPMNWETLPIMEPASADSIRRVADLLWPEGNPKFCETIMSFAKNMLELEEMVETLILEGLNVRGKSTGAHFDLLGHSIRMSHYGSPGFKESISMELHYDPSMTTMILQDEVEGLEVHAGDKGWVAIPPEPGTLAFMAGEQFRVFTNGRVPACLHRVRTPSNRERLSVQFQRNQKDGVEVRALDDLVDADHPLQFNPLWHEEYSKWRFSEEGLKYSTHLKSGNLLKLDALKAYCGVKDGAVLV